MFAWLFGWKKSQIALKHADPTLDHDLDNSFLTPTFNDTKRGRIPSFDSKNISTPQPISNADTKHPRRHSENSVKVVLSDRRAPSIPEIQVSESMFKPVSNSFSNTSFDSPKVETEWVPLYSDMYHTYYYWNKKTKEVTWTAPANVRVEAIEIQKGTIEEEAHEGSDREDPFEESSQVFVSEIVQKENLITEETLEDSSAKIEALEESVKKLTLANSELERKCEQLSVEKLKIEALHENVLKEKDEMSPTEVNLDCEEISKLKEENISLSGKIESLQETNEKLNETVISIEKEKGLLEGEKVSLTKEIEALRKEIVSIENVNESSLKSENENMKEQIEELKEIVKQWKSKCETSMEELGKMKTTVDGLEKQNVLSVQVEESAKVDTKMLSDPNAPVPPSMPPGVVPIAEKEKKAQVPSVTVVPSIPQAPSPPSVPSAPSPPSVPSAPSPPPVSSTPSPPSVPSAPSPPPVSSAPSPPSVPSAPSPPPVSSAPSPPPVPSAPVPPGVPSPPGGPPAPPLKPSNGPSAVPGGPSASPPAMKSTKPKKKLRALFWDKINKKDCKGTIWEPWTQEEYPLPESHIDIYFVEVKKEGLEEEKVKRSKSPKTIKQVLVTDDKAQMGISLLLGRIKTSTEEYAKSILKMDDSIVKDSHVKQLLNFLPEDDGVSFADFEGDIGQLGKVCKLYYDLCGFSHIRKRLDLWVFKNQFLEDITDFEAKLDFVEKSIHWLDSSKSLSKMLQLVLHLGNYLNQGHKTKGNAYGFRIPGTFSKLAQTKSFQAPDIDSPKNVLEYVIVHFQKNDPSVIEDLFNIDFMREAQRVEQIPFLTAIQNMNNRMKSIPKYIALPSSHPEEDESQDKLREFFDANALKIEQLNTKSNAFVEEIQRISRHFGDSKQPERWEEYFEVFITFADELKSTLSDLERRQARHEKIAIKEKKKEAKREEKLKKKERRKSRPLNFLLA